MESQFKLTSGSVVSSCCVGFTSLDIVCDELNDCAWNFVCSCVKSLTVWLFIL